MAIATPTIAVDHVTASVIQGALENIAVEMGYKLMRMSYSSIIRESEDFGATLVDAQGRGLAESAQFDTLAVGTHSRLCARRPAPPAGTRRDPGTG
jgi:N-methylhydantoinase B/oxoprolinase/acetone carboxylase alpha subunit